MSSSSVGVVANALFCPMVSAGRRCPETSLPVVGLRPAVVVALTVGHADGGHQRDAHRPAQRGKHAANAPVVDPLRSGLAAAVRAVREDDRVHAIDRGSQRVGTCEITHDHLHIGERSACFVGIAGKGPYSVALPNGLRDDETPDAAGGSNNQHGHTLITHAGITSSMARNALRVRGYQTLIASLLPKYASGRLREA